MSIAQHDEKQQDHSEAIPEGNDKEDVETSEDSDSDEDDEEGSESESEEVIARKLGEQLLEDIRRAREAKESSTPPVQVLGPKTPKEDAALATIQSVLSFAESDQLVRTTLSDTSIPGIPGTNVFMLLHKIIKEGRIAPQVAGPLSHVLVKLAKSEVLFSPLPSLPPDTLKRKRDETEEDSGPSEKRTAS